jgi:mRNA interferase RelE/StbE
MEITMPFAIKYASRVVSEDIPALPKANRLQIKTAIERRLTVDPVGFGKPLRFSLRGHRRLRIGDWRVIYRIEGNCVMIVKIGNRKEVYNS